MRVKEEYKKSGYFWLPGQNEKKVPGTLYIKDGGNIELEIVGFLDDSLKDFASNDKFERIVGAIEGGKYVTLENCFYKRKQLPLAEVTKSTLYSNMVLSGAMWEKGEGVTFNSLLFSFDLLDEWLSTNNIEVAYSEDFKGATIIYNQSSILSHELDNGMTLEISFKNTLPSIGPHFTEAKITQEAFYILKSEEPRLLDDFRNIIYKIQNIICLAVDATVSLKWMQGRSNDIQMKISDSKSVPVDIDIYYASKPFTEHRPNKSWHEIFFTYQIVKDKAQDIFNNWINAYEDLSPVLGLYFSTQTDSYDYLEGEFLAFAQGIETLHRRTNDEKWKEPSEYQKIVDEIMKSCPKGLESWLNGRLMYGNEVSLRKRIKQTIEPFKRHLGNTSSRNKFIGEVVDTRNYLTHYDVTLKERACTGKELWELNQKLEAIFQLHLLSIIGFNDSEIENVINNCRALKQKISKFQCISNLAS